MSYYMMNGMGAIDFNAGATWSDWLAGANGDNAAGKRAADSLRAALGQLGYGPFTLGVGWGSSQDKAGYGKFASDNGISAPSGMPSWWPSQQGVDKLGELVAAGGTPGGGPVQEFHAGPGGVLIPGAAPGTAPIGAAKAGMSGGMQVGLMIAALAAVAGLAVLAKKKKAAAGHASSAGFTDLAVRSVPATPNRRRRRSRR